MAPKQSRHDGGADLALRQQLAEIKKVSLESVGRIRMTPEKMPSLVDVGVILTGKTARHVARDLQVIMDKHPDMVQKVGYFQFGGRGNQDTPVPKNLATLIEIIFLLPGRSAAKVRQSAAQIFVRYLGGDLSLIHEVERMNHVQTFLRENDPEHPLRAFGEYAEQRQAEEDLTTTQPKRRRVDDAPMSDLSSSLPMALPEDCLDWMIDFAVSRQELRGVKSQFKAILSIEISAGQLPQRSPVELWTKAPPLRFREMAVGAVSSYRSLLERQYGTMAAGDAEHASRRPNQGSDSDDDDDILKISEIMSTAGVWQAVWPSYRSDLSMQMLALKCIQTGARFSERRPEIVQGHIPVLVHKYKKSTDWPLAWTALQNTRDLYEKRVREVLNDLFRMAGRPTDESILLARDIATLLRVSA
jgi:hypothetical protein